jgi:hypothetical protein
MTRFLNWLSTKLPSRMIPRDDGGPYLQRVKLRGWMPGVQSGKYWWSAYLHKFFSHDVDTALHSHPWRLAVSIVLPTRRGGVWGGYTEERLETGPWGCEVVTRRLGPLSINVLYADTFHRISELHGEPWTLFFVWKKNSSWGFLVDGEVVPWRKRLEQRGIPIEKELAT